MSISSSIVYSKISKGVKIEVIPSFLENESFPENDEYVWAYKVSIENLTGKTFKLRSRHWIITDKLGRVMEVKGQGVVGEEPVLKPGEHFEYTSGVPLSTPSGLMLGTYELENDDGKKFSVEIPVFSLDSPHEIIVLN